MKGQHPPKLRTVITWAAAGVAALAILVAVSLIALTTLLHSVTEDLGLAVESVRLGEEARADLLLHARAGDALIKRRLEADLSQRLTEARQFLITDRKRAALDEVETYVEAYFAVSQTASDGPAVSARRDAAYAALEQFVALNVGHAREQRERAEEVDQLGNILGAGTAVLLIVIAGALVWWVRVFAVRPVLSLAEAMGRFEAGEHGARAEEAGAAELRAIARQFNEMASTLESQRDAQLTFLASVAHDLRTPLSALHMSTALIAPDEPLPPEAELRRTVAIVSRQVVRLERMVGDLLDRAAIESGRLELRMERRDLAEIARDVVDLFQATSPEHPIELTLPGGALDIPCDPVRIEQVITNLVSNAIKYSPPGARVTVTAERCDGELAVSVRDQGVGISSEDQQRLFEPFRRGRASGQMAPGVGLGLFAVRRIVQAHAGRIEVESRPGTGSTFRIWLPLAPRADDRPSSARQPELH